MSSFYPQAFLSIVLLMVISECSDIPIVTAFQEQDVVLSCLNSGMDPKSCYRAMWKKSSPDAGQMKPILAWPKTPKIQVAERVKWEIDGNGHMSLYLTRIQKSDEGDYSCEIWTGWDCIFVKKLSLKVKDCKTLQGVKAVHGTAIDLSCPVDTTSGQKGSPRISWVMLKGGNPKPVNSSRAQINGTLLAFPSLNYSDGGWYRCNYTLGQSQRCFDINLHINLHKAYDTTEIHLETRSSEALTAAVASVITVIAIIAASIALFVYCRCTTRRVGEAQGPSAGAHTESIDCYEIVTLTHTEDPPNNSLYQQIQEECLHTFQI